MAEYRYDARAYEERYRKVYEAGAEFWEELKPTEALVRFLSESHAPKDLNAVDLGCGEGRDTIFLAKKGFNVAGVDTARSALRRAKKRADQEETSASFLVADILNLPLRDGVYDLAVNISCLNMVTCQSARNKHLREASRVLKQGGVYFSCNLGVDEFVSVEGFYERLGKRPGDLIVRKIKVHGEEKEIELPIIAAWPKSKEQYSEEFEKAGFTVVQIDKEHKKPDDNCWVLLARKT